jgi:tripartite-type tricarboxylate transporter receptor subunit TctC
MLAMLLPEERNVGLQCNLRLLLVFTAPVASISRQPQLLLLNPSVPATTVPEFIAYAKANPGKINMGSPGIGTGPHLSGELFKLIAGLNLVHVPYRGGGPALTDLLGGQVQVMFLSPLGVIEYFRVGKLRALAVTTATRSDALPGLPALGDFVPGYESSAWFGVSAPNENRSDKCFLRCVIFATHHGVIMSVQLVERSRVQSGRP